MAEIEDDPKNTEVYDDIDNVTIIFSRWFHR